MVSDGGEDDEVTGGVIQLNAEQRRAIEQDELLLEIYRLEVRIPSCILPFCDLAKGLHGFFLLFDVRAFPLLLFGIRLVAVFFWRFSFQTCLLDAFRRQSSKHQLVVKTVNGIRNGTHVSRMLNMALVSTVPKQYDDQTILIGRV